MDTTKLWWEASPEIATRRRREQALLLPVSELAESTISMFSMQSNTILLEEMSNVFCAALVQLRIAKITEKNLVSWDNDEQIRPINRILFFFHFCGFREGVVFGRAVKLHSTL
jgi:hypothetical protein